MTDDRKAKMLERVRALLAKADSTQFPQEADTFREKADELMTAYAIEQWQVDEAQAGVGARTKPVKQEFDFNWFYTSDRQSELWTMFCSVARHCRCVVATRGVGGSKIPVIGLPSDLEYFDMLFTHLMLQMGKQLEPKPDPTNSFAQNAYELRAAGVQRVRVIELLYKAQLIPGYESDERPFNEVIRAEEKKLRAKVRTAGERYAKQNGLDSTTRINPGVYQRSFALGFVYEIQDRLTAMRRDQEQAPRADEGPSVAVAMRDIRQQALELYDELYPPTAVRGRARGRSVIREVKVDGSARRAGVEAGRKANLAANPGKGLRNRREIKKG